MLVHQRVQLLAADQFKFFTVQQIGDLPRPAIRSEKPQNYVKGDIYSHLIVSHSYIFQQKYINPQATAFNHSDFGPIPAFSRDIYIYTYIYIYIYSNIYMYNIYIYIYICNIYIYDQQDIRVFHINQRKHRHRRWSLSMRLRTRWGCAVFFVAAWSLEDFHRKNQEKP